MRNYPKFGCGFVLGIAFAVLFLPMLSILFHDEKKPKAKYYVTVLGKNGDVTLYLGMPRDSVRLLLGKPSTQSLSASTFVTSEYWGYKINNDFIEDLTVIFENDKLIKINQD